MKTQEWIGSLLALGLLACGAPNGYVIQGEVTGFPDSTLFYLTSSAVPEYKDSAWVVGGQFQMKGVLPDEPRSIWLTAKVGDQMKTVSILMGNERVKVQGDISDFPDDVLVSGSRYNEQWEELDRLTAKYDRQKDSVALILYRQLSPEERVGEKGKALENQMHGLQQTIDSLERDFIFKRTDTYPSLIYLQYKMYDYPKDTVRMLFDRMSPELQASSWAKPIRTYLESESIAVGDLFFDFEAEDQNGNRVRLSDFVGKEGKYVLLDFTATGCGVCRMAEKEMFPMVDTYSDSLRIVSFWVDPSRDIWQKSLRKDSLCWTSLWSAENADNGHVTIPYQVRGFPAFFVIDPQGVIVQKWMGYGPGIFEEKIGRLKNK